MSSSEVRRVGTATSVRRCCGDAAAQFQRRQQGSAKPPGHDVVDERDGWVDCRDQSQDRKEQQPSQVHAAQRDDRQRDGQQAGGDDRASADIAADSERSVEAPGPGSCRRLESNLCFET